MGAQPFLFHSSQVKKNNNLIILLLITGKFAYVYDQMRVKTHFLAQDLETNSILSEGRDCRTGLI